MEPVLKILTLEDSDQDAELILYVLRKSDLRFEIERTETKDMFFQKLVEFNPDLVLADNTLPQFSGIEALELARECYPQVPFILVTGTVSDEFAVSVIKRGADDYILKDRLERLPSAIKAILKQRLGERQRMEAIQKLVESEAKYRTLVEQAFDGILVYEQGGRIVDCNESMCRYSGYSPDELKELTIGQLFFAGEALTRHLDPVVQGGASLFDYCTLKNKTGGGVDMEFVTKRLPNSCYMTVGRDISKRKEAERKLVESEENLKAIFENASEGFILVDENGLVRAFNKNAKINLLLNLEKEIQVGMSMQELVAADRKQFFNDVVARVMAGLTIEDDRFYPGTGINGVWINYTLNPVRKAGKIVGLCITSRDITERINAQTALRRLEEERMKSKIEEQRRITEAMLQAQEKERNAIGLELHDNVNQILVGTTLQLSLIRKSPARHMALLDECMDNIKNAINENRKIAHELVTPDATSETLLDLIERLCANMLLPAEIETSVHRENFDEKLVSEKGKLAVYRILQEQCINIIKHARAKRVAFSLSTAGHILNLRVTDDGMGAERTQMANGIGLQNMISRLSTLGGALSIETQPGAGFTLQVKVPLAR